VSKARLETFSDGVIAILITIMVLEMKVPHGENWHALAPLVPVFLSYVLSYVYLGIYWTNHHHMFHLVERCDGRILWANLHLLFWLSLFPFVTGWMGENDFQPIPTAAYGVVAFCSALSWQLLQRAIFARQGPESPLKAALGATGKEWLSTGLYASAIPLAFVHHALSLAIYVGVALVWLVPDRRIEKRLEG
jgi:uncharacterized membrane protein